MTGLPEPRPTPRSHCVSNQRRGLLQIHIATLFFGCAGLFGKLLDVGPATITAGRTLFGSLALFAACWLTGSNLRIRGWRDWSMLLAAGVFLAIHWYTFFAAIQTSTVAIGLLAFASFPMFVTFLEPVFFGDRLTLFDAVLAAIVVAGLILLSPAFDLSDNSMSGVCWGIVSGFTFAVYSLLCRVNVRHFPQLTVTAYQQTFAFLFVLPLAISSSSVSLLTFHTVWMLAILGVVFTAAAHALFIGSLKFLRAQTASIIVSLEPVYGIVLAAFILKELPSPRTVLGGILILASALFSTTRIAKKPAAQAPML